jgi:hypothetical protein
MRVFDRLYGFLLYNNCIVLILSSSLNTYYAILDHPKDVAAQLAQLLPNVSSFFITYIMIKLLVGETLQPAYANQGRHP